MSILRDDVNRLYTSYNNRI